MWSLLGNKGQIATPNDILKIQLASRDPHEAHPKDVEFCSFAYVSESLRLERDRKKKTI